MRGTLIISLDFELHWGGFEKWSLGPPQCASYDRYFRNTREVIPGILELFERNNIHVTWATVGFLLHNSKNELLANAPELKPTYNDPSLSAYRYIHDVGIGNDEETDPFHFAPTLVRRILNTPNQELGTHTFSHYYCNEAGQDVAQFQEDIRAAKRVTSSYGVELKSLVFPRNQFNDEYLKACYQEGIRTVRSNPRDWFWEINSTISESPLKRLTRGLDAYIPIGKKTSFRLEELPVREGMPLCLPASRLLRPYRKKEMVLNKLKIRRIMAEVERAAIHGENYHLWWHPHNFANFPLESLEGLEAILKHFNYCKNKFGMQSLHMNEISGLVFEMHGKAKAA